MTPFDLVLKLMTLCVENKDSVEFLELKVIGCVDGSYKFETTIGAKPLNLQRFRAPGVQVPDDFGTALPPHVKPA